MTGAPVAVFRYKLRLRLLLLFLFIILLAVMGWMGSITVQMVSRLSEPYMMAMAIPSVFVSLSVLLVLVLFGYTALFCWTYRLELGESHLQTRMIYYPFVHPFRHAYDDIVQIRRGMMRGLLEVVPQVGRPLRVGVRVFDGEGERLPDELSRRVNAERVEPDLGTRLWEYTWFDRLRLAFTIVILASQFGLFGLFVGHYFILALNLPHRLPDWVWRVTGVEARWILLLCSSVAIGVYAAVYMWQRRAWRSGGTQRR